MQGNRHILVKAGVFTAGRCMYVVKGGTLAARRVEMIEKEGSVLYHGKG